MTDIRHILKFNETPIVSSSKHSPFEDQDVYIQRPKFVEKGSTNSPLRPLGMMLSSTTLASSPWFLDPCILSIMNAVSKNGH